MLRGTYALLKWLDVPSVRMAVSGPHKNQVLSFLLFQTIISSDFVGQAKDTYYSICIFLPEIWTTVVFVVVVGSRYHTGFNFSGGILCCSIQELTRLEYDVMRLQIP